MSMDRAERTGFGIAIGGHLLLFALLYVGFAAAPPPLPLHRQPVEVQIVDEVGLESGAPQISNEAPAPKLAEEEGPVEPAPPPPPQPAPQPEPKAMQKPAPAPSPIPAPKPVKQPPRPAAAAPSPKPAPPKAKPAPPVQTNSASTSKTRSRPTGRLKGLLNGLSDADSDSKSTTPPAATITPAVQASLAAAIRRQLKPHWNPPTGADSDQLRTELTIRLARDGTVTDIRFNGQSGITASNRPQAPLHKEQAIKAVRLASPFQLPPQYYDSWKEIGPIGFDARLAR
jgi:outer membrane biosynthesis protein TonB